MSSLVGILGGTTTQVTVTGTSIDTLFSQLVLGGYLGTDNRLRLESSGRISFAAGAQATFYLVYAGLTVASCTAENSGGTDQIDKGLVIKAELRGDNSINSQYGTIQVKTGLPLSSDGSTPIGQGSVAGGSGGDQTIAIKCGWNAVGSTNSIVHRQTMLELLAFVDETPLPSLDEPNLYIYSSSKLNNLRYDLRKDIYFYANLEHELEFFGYGSVTFTRTASSTAIWRDGASHTVDANRPRFEYSGDDPIGIALNTATETLDYSADNNLHDSNTLCWVQEGVYKSTRRGDTNIFNSSGTFIGTTGVHYSHIVKFNREITAAEDNEMEIILTT